MNIVQVKDYAHADFANPVDETCIKVFGLKAYQGSTASVKKVALATFLPLSAVATAIVATGLPGATTLLFTGVILGAAVVTGLISYKLKELMGVPTAAGLLAIQAAAGAYVVMALGSCPLGVAALAGGIIGVGLGLVTRTEEIDLRPLRESIARLKKYQVLCVAGITVLSLILGTTWIHA